MLIIVDSAYVPGHYIGDIYGAENCCDGLKNIRYYFIEDVQNPEFTNDCPEGELCVDF